MYLIEEMEDKYFEIVMQIHMHMAKVVNVNNKEGRTGWIAITCHINTVHS